MRLTPIGVMTGMALMAGPMIAAGQSTAPITGTVRDADHGSLLRGVEIRSLGSGQHSHTNSLGRFRINTLTRGDTLVLRRIGYRSIRYAIGSGAGPLTIRLQPAPLILPTVVSTATRQPTSAVDLITPVLVQDRAAITESGARSLDQVIQELPGIQQIAEPPARNTVMIRGIGGNRVLILIDGEPAAGALLEDRDLSRISTTAVEQVEVVKGPLSALYGSEAIGGVVNVITRAPSGPLTLEVGGDMGSAGRQTASFTASRGGALAWRLAGSVRRRDQIASQVEQPGATQRVWDIRGTTRTALTDGLTLRLDASYMRERQRWPVDASINAFNDNRSIGGWLEISDHTNERWRARIAVQDFSHRYRESAGSQPIAGTGTPQQHEQSARLLLTHARTLGSLHTLGIGVETGARRIRATDRVRGGELSEETADAWVQDAFRSGRWLATASLRTSWSSRWGTTFTPAVEAAFEPTPTLRLRGSLARGFRGPTFKETGWNFANVSAGYIVEGNTALRPERSWQVAGGATVLVLPGLTLDAELFRNDLRDLIDLQPVGVNPAGLLRYAAVNVDAARTQGLDLTVRSVGGSGSLEFGWSWLGTINRATDAPLTRRIPHMLRAAARHRLGALTISGSGRWSAATAESQTDPERQGAFMAWDVALSWTLGMTTLDAGIDNLFDARPTGWQAPIGRTVRLGLRSSWRP